MCTNWPFGAPAHWMVLFVLQSLCWGCSGQHSVPWFLWCSRLCSLSRCTPSFPGNACSRRWEASNVSRTTDIKTNWRFTVRFTASVAGTGGRLALWYHVYGSSWTAKIIQTNNLIITREAGWCYGIMSTVPHEQQKLYRQIILLLHGRPVWRHVNRQLVMISMAMHFANLWTQTLHYRCFMFLPYPITAWSFFFVKYWDIYQDRFL